MWGALKNDFTEFVSTVTTDAAETLTAIDVQLDVGDMKRRAERMDSMRMTDPDSRLVVDESDSDSEPSPPPSMEEMRDFLHGCEALFLEVLPDPEETTTAAADSPDDDNEDDGDDAPAALVTLDLNEKTEDIANLLKSHASLETTFSSLTDQVEYKDFWKRYYWRLDPSRLRDTYEYYYEMEQQQQQQVAAANVTAASGSNAALASVTSFLGGAVKRMIDDEGNEAVDGDQQQPQPQLQQEGQFFNTAQQTSVSAMNFFKNAGVGRPPFVLNTAVSEDDEDGEEDEDEEEFGWDDDEEDDDDDEDADDNNEEGGEDKDEDEGDDNEGQIEFKDAEKEQLQEELAQAMIERDMLHKTVEMQTDELKKLKEGVASKDESQQVQALKMQVFETKSELAALRARLEEEDDDAAANTVGDTTTATTPPPTASSVELKSLQSEVASRDVEILQLKQGLQASVDRSRTLEEQLETEASDTHHQLNDALQASKSQQSALEQASAQNTELETGLEAMRTAMANLEADYDILQQEQARAQKTPGTEMKAQLAVAQKDLVKAHSQVDTLSSQTESLNDTLQQHVFRISQLEDDLSSTQTALQQKEEDLANKVASWHATQSELEQTKAELEKAVTVTLTLAATTKAAQPSSPGSNSTGVQVPSSPVAGAPESPDPKPPVLDAIPVDLPVAAADDGNDGNADEENDDGSDWGDW